LMMAPCVAQSTPAPNGQSSSASPSRAHRPVVPGGERSMKGCVVKNAEGEYFLVSQRGGRVKLEAAEEMGSHVGQLVRASGAFLDTHEKGSSSAAPSTMGSSGKTVLHPEREFRVLKIDVLSQTCVTTPAKKR
jgi:hypothetical protein